MSASHGKDIYVGTAVADADAPTTNLSSYCNKFDLPRLAETAETTVFGLSDKTYIPGLKGASFSMEGIWDTTIDGILDGLLGTEFAIFYAPGGSGTTGYYANAILTGYSPPGDLNDAVKWTASGIITGGVTRATVTAA